MIAYAKTIRCGNYVEVRQYEQPVYHGFTAKRTSSVRKPGRERRADNVARSKKTLLRKTLANTSQFRSIFFTLTYERNEVSRGVVLEDTRVFIRKLRKAYPRAGYMYVFEKQKRGAIHVHMLVFFVGFLPVEQAQSWWLHGNVFISKNSGRRATTNDRHRAHYVAKYCGKDFVDSNSRAFNASLNLNKPEVCYFYKFNRLLCLDYKLKHVFGGGGFTPLGNFYTVNIYTDQYESI